MKPLFIISGLYLGDRQTGGDLKTLTANSIVAIVNIGCGQGKYPSQFAYHRISLEDSSDDSISPHLDSVTLFIDTWIKKGNVLVHCRGALSRSPSVVIAYLAKYKNMSVDESFELVQKRRTIYPRKEFISEIRAWLNPK